MAIKNIIFDLDGTLIDTVKDLNAAVNYALNEKGFPLRTIDQTRNDIGNGVAKLMERSIPGGICNPEYTNCLDIFKTYYRNHYFDYSLPYKNIGELLKELKAKGYHLSVVSNKFNEGANKMIRHFFGDTFDIIQGEEEKYRKKPYPDMVNAVIEKMSYKPEECLYVGDTEIDYLTANSVRIPVILVSYGYRSRIQLEEKIKGATIINAPLDLLKFLGQ